MKKTLITVIITLLAGALALFAYNSIWGEGCVLLANDKECTETAQHQDCDYAKKDGDKMKSSGHHEQMMDKLRPMRAEFESELSEQEKEVIAGIRKKFEGVDHTKMCPDGQKKFMEQNKEDFSALGQIADNHSEYLDALYNKMHKEMGECCEKNKASMKEKPEGESVKKAQSGCPEAQKCKEATEKCKGEEEKKTEECKEATKKCQEECMSTFKAHFLLLDY